MEQLAMPSVTFVYYGANKTMTASLMPSRIFTVVYGISPNSTEEEIIFKGSISQEMISKIMPTATAKGFTSVRIVHPEVQS
jgi:hypothetical protein